MLRGPAVAIIITHLLALKEESQKRRRNMRKMDKNKLLQNCPVIDCPEFMHPRSESFEKCSLVAAQVRIQRKKKKSDSQL